MTANQPSFKNIDLAQRLINERGYLVIGFRFPHTLGERFDYVGGTTMPDSPIAWEGIPFTLVQETDAADFLEQRRFCNALESVGYRRYFYRISLD